MNNVREHGYYGTDHGSGQAANNKVVKLDSVQLNCAKDMRDTDDNKENKVNNENRK
jgi:hypothetical protein